MALGPVCTISEYIQLVRQSPAKSSGTEGSKTTRTSCCRELIGAQIATKRVSRSAFVPQCPACSLISRPMIGSGTI